MVQSEGAVAPHPDVSPAADPPADDRALKSARKFKERLSRNAQLKQAVRQLRIKSLSSITNSSCYRDGLSDAASADMSAALASLVDVDRMIAIEDLKYVRRLGEGGFAFVDLYEKRGGEPDAPTVKYAAKVMKDKMLLPPENVFVEAKQCNVPESAYIKFLSEAVLLSSLKHPNVVGCYGCVRELPFDAKGQKVPPKLLQEFCPGGTLLDRLNAHDYSSLDAMHWLHQTALGMQYLHDSAGMHRDLKPENVLLKDNVAKVADFGLFRIDPANVKHSDSFNKSFVKTHAPLASGGSGKSLLDQLLSGVKPAKQPSGEAKVPSVTGTQSAQRSKPTSSLRQASLKKLKSSGTLLSMTKRLEPSAREVTRMTGTARYMAPECHELSTVDVYTNSVDVFSFGIMAYEMLAGKRAYEDMERLTMDQIAKAVHTRGLRPTLPKEWSPEIRSLLERAWHADAAQRPTFKALAHEIQAMIQKAEAEPDGMQTIYGVLDQRRTSKGCGCVIS